MILTALAVILLASATPIIHNFNVAVLPANAYFRQVTIEVDPVPTETTAGWLGIQAARQGDLVQVGWLNASGNLSAFYQVWQDGVIIATSTVGPVLHYGDNLTIAMSTNGRGQWLTWVKSGSKWSVVWMGEETLTLKTGIWVIATETVGPGRVPRLNYRIDL